MTISSFDEIGSDQSNVPPSATSDGVVRMALIANQNAFVNFLNRRVANRSTAEDIFQTFCLRAITKSSNLNDNSSVMAWLFRILRSVLTDHYRSEAARQRRDDHYAQEQIVLGTNHVDIEPEGALCMCFLDLLPKLRPEYADVLWRVDLAGEPREKVAADLRTTSANVRVRLHRARSALRKALGECCGSCCENDYRDCTCNKSDGKNSRKAHCQSLAS